MEFVLILLLIVVIASVGGGLFMFKRKAATAPAPSLPTQTLPDIPALIGNLRQAKITVNDLKIRRLIDDAANRTEDFFVAVSRKDPDHIDGFRREFGRHLVDAQRVVTMFASAESNPAQPEREQILADTRAALEGYAAYANTSISKVGMADLVPFRVISRELAAKKLA